MADEQTKAQARQLRDSPLLRAITDGMSSDIVERWKAASTRKRRESAWRELQAVEALQVALYAEITNVLGDERNE
jgi:hypothetical protein